MTRESEPRGHAHRGTALAVAPRDLPAIGGFDDASAQQAGEESLHLRDLLRIFLKHKWTILAIVTASALFSVVTTYLASPVYRASATIQIERSTPRILNFQEVSPGEATDMWSDSENFYATNYELLKSRSMAERVVEDLGLRKNVSSASLSPDQAEAPATPAPPRAGNFLEGIVTWEVRDDN